MEKEEKEKRPICDDEVLLKFYFHFFWIIIIM